jgi:hypothetical protein
MKCAILYGSSQVYIREQTDKGNILSFSIQAPTYYKKHSHSIHLSTANMQFKSTLLLHLLQVTFLIPSSINAMALPDIAVTNEQPNRTIAGVTVIDTPL